VDRRGSSCLARAALVLAFTFAFMFTLALTARAARADQLLPPPPTLATLLQRARSTRLAESRDWQVLLHYRRTTPGGWKSEADGPGFFFAGTAGKTDPAIELAATLTAFFRPAVADPTNPQTMHPQCLFPARYAGLKHELAIEHPRDEGVGAGAGSLAAAQLVDQPCPLLDSWRTGISAEAVTLVYATAFLNSPASMYGHTFLRVSRATGEGNPLLDYVVNFAADVDTKNGLVYAVRGVTGGFPGRFFVVPYYVKVQEYSNMESRDLWEYELSFTREQVQRLVLHAWETRTTYFDYYFIDENCSYQLLTLLEVADPSLHLLDRFGARVVPADTVRVVLDQVGLVRRQAARPSLVGTMTERKARLDSREVRAAEAWVTTPADSTAPDVTGIPPARQAQIIDAAYDYLRYREGPKEPGEDFQRHERRLLLARGRLGVPPQEITVHTVVDAPERGHGTLRVAVGAGVTDVRGTFETLSIRAALHDFLDASPGYPLDAQLEMAQLRVRFDNQSRRVRLDRADLINILSAAPLDRWVHSVSWKAWIGADNARELGCERADSDRAGWRCLYVGGTFGGGVAARFGPRQRLLTFAMAETDAGAGPAFAAGHNYRAGLGGEAGLIGDAGAPWRFQLGARYIYYALGETRPAFTTRVAQAFSIGRGLSLRLAVDTAGAYAQATTELAGYF
jgi:hypothetical protein